ncbi:FecR family protein [Psychrosphaera algicola]|uniref:FecR family protein n=1 Tax=Psychrosphaera algicola TaxID=3023714 RepID=A0ABT5FES1_9GAMM|nr:FecR family protein [Psychrosphaera sp. G1-22]MDC2889457.1 FecR family protein [Psychrosphaera sp. G1-22]
MLIRSVLLLSGLMFISNGQAQTAAGKTLVTRGAVSAISSSGADTRKLKRRSPIYSSDVVSTGANAKAQLRMTDGGMIALKENSELLISDYKFSDDNGRGSVVMELVKGGLRSVTGSIKAESGDYKLKTPVGSIGIRGTHYEVEIVGGTIWVAVWDGAVDLDITSGDQSGSTLSLGQNEGYSYASIDPQGKVTTFIEPLKHLKPA